MGKQPKLLGEQLRELIRASDEAPFHFAKRAGVHPTQIYHFLSGDRPNIKIGTVEKIVAALGLELTAKNGDRA